MCSRSRRPPSSGGGNSWVSPTPLRSSSHSGWRRCSGRSASWSGSAPARDGAALRRDPAVQRRIPSILNAGDYLLRNLTFYFRPPRRRGIVRRDWWRSPSRVPGHFPLRAPWALRLMEKQRASSYSATLWGKLQGDLWRDGSAVSFLRPARRRHPSFPRRRVSLLDPVVLTELLTIFGTSRPRAEPRRSHREPGSASWGARRRAPLHLSIGFLLSPASSSARCSPPGVRPPTPPDPLPAGAPGSWRRRATVWRGCRRPGRGECPTDVVMPSDSGRPAGRTSQDRHDRARAGSDRSAATREAGSGPRGRSSSSAPAGCSDRAGRRDARAPELRRARGGRPRRRQLRRHQDRTVLTEIGPVEIEVPATHFDEVYGATVSRDTVSRITATVLEELTAWQNRPLDRGAVRRRHLPRGPRRSGHRPAPSTWSSE